MIKYSFKNILNQPAGYIDHRFGNIYATPQHATENSEPALRCGNLWEIKKG